MSDQHFPEQDQSQPGHEHKMTPEPEYIRDDYEGSKKLKGKKALITGGDSGIGRAVAVHFAREGADVAISYLCEDADAEETRKLVEAEGRQFVAFKGDLGEAAFCHSLVEESVKALGGLNVLVNNAAEQHDVEGLEALSEEQIRRTFDTNILSQFYVVKAALAHLGDGDSIISSSSINAFKGNDTLIDYSTTKGAIQAFMRSMAINLVGRGIRFNAVAPGPVWTPLIPATMDEEKVAQFGGQVPMNRAGQPSEMGPAYVYLACKDSSYMTGQTLHLNGGVVVNT
ncbi:SDR family oxidoreductase [Larsenimonas salina]|uniref:SDR family oxidoreductase n=1 Tax=Larsenimonas salina TaxID=1295565 RepID=UPI002072BF2F|nr:SDR family oxidoreductase [Larsenimonas salina]MCM5704623.1 SDR family oxidoreductase [Larsenimonas salina]